MNNTLTGSEVKQLRLKMNMSGERFCLHCGVSRTTLVHIERGTLPISSGLEVRFLYAFASYCYVKSIELPPAWSYKEAIYSAIAS